MDPNFRKGLGKSANKGQGREIVIKQNSHFNHEDLEELSRLVARGMVRIGPIIRDVVPVSEAKEYSIPYVITRTKSWEPYSCGRRRLEYDIES